MKKLLLVTAVCFTSLSLFAQAQKITVLTYNIHHGENVKGVVDLQGITNVILATNPDLVALQEVDSATQRTQKLDELKELASVTGMYTYFAKSMDFDGGAYGTGILSRYPITEGTTLPLPGAKGQEPRAVGIVSVKLPNDSLLHFACTHLDASDNSNERIAQANTLVEYFNTLKAPVILAGDFNASPSSKEIAVMKQLFTDITEKAGHTFPSDTPKVKLDYILVHPKHRWQPLSARVIEETIASDHRPVLSELSMISN
ncbi:endonuclease/exonuclease/phosphatase family protein [Chitinophaga vietnamensis]|uniref:endonuclease/exonuclease/phosphatase family protein n=1 Tax=Chitinophaga vietnamensis TaxID=2593957 RepID=UPI001177EB4E|nr:endonuclease/exonuclease/phosphatase family protein [Chitinophaga vietnamensis]